MHEPETEQLVQFITHMSGTEHLDLPVVEQLVHGTLIWSDDLSSDYIAVYEGSCTGLFDHAELRLSRTGSFTPSLILHLASRTWIARSSITNNYPETTLEVLDPNALVKTTLSTNVGDIHISFGFGDEDRLVRVVVTRAIDVPAPPENTEFDM